MPAGHPVKPPVHTLKPDPVMTPKKKPTLLEEMGRRIRQGRLELSAREGKALTQGDIAERLGVAQSTVGRWEAGLKEPDLETIRRIAALFGTTPDYIAFGTQPPPGALPVRGENQVPSVREEPTRDKVDPAQRAAQARAAKERRGGSA